MASISVLPGCYLLHASSGQEEPDADGGPDGGTGVIVGDAAGTGSDREGRRGENAGGNGGEGAADGVSADRKYRAPCTNETEYQYFTGTDERSIESYRYVFDQHGNILVWETDELEDGTVDSRTIYTYDERGNELSSAADFGADETIDYRTTRTYHADGNLLSLEIDNDGDGTAEVRHIFTYECWR